MRKSFLAIAIAAITAMSVVNTNTLVQAGTKDCKNQPCQIKTYIISGNGENCKDALKKALSDCDIKVESSNLNRCPAITCPKTKCSIVISGTCAQKPQNPDTNCPDTDVAETEQQTEPTVDNPPETSTQKPEDFETEQPGEKETTKNETTTETVSEDDAYIEEVVELVNQERVKAGLGKVVLDKTIQKAAMIRVKEIEVSFSHTRPNGSSFSSVLKENGISYHGAGENIAWGQTSPKEVMKAWMNSDGHRANILNPNFKKIGVGYYKNASGRKYWSQLFVY